MIFGKLKLPTKLDIYFGVYVGVVSRCEFDFINDMWIVTLFWSIWHHRNDVVWNDNPSLPNQIGRMANDVWNDWFVVHHLRHDENYNLPPPTIDR
jgi:hypothetical protein